MGWWDAPQGLLGDGPVDLIEDVMSDWTQTGRPSWQQLLNGIAAALADAGEEWLADPEAVRRTRIRATFAHQGPTPQIDPAAPRDRYYGMWTQAFEQVSEEYEATQGRKPTLREVLGTVAFSLSVAPERFVQNDEGWTLTGLDAAGEDGA